MLYHLLFPLAEHIGGLNLFRYITFRTAGATTTAITRLRRVFSSVR